MPSNTKVLKVNKMAVAFGIALAHVTTDAAVDLLTGPIYQVGKHRYGRRFNDDIDNYGNRVMLVKKKAACWASTIQVLLGNRPMNAWNVNPMNVCKPHSMMCITRPSQRESASTR